MSSSAPDSTIKWSVRYGFSVFNLFVLTPILAYYLYKFWTLRQEKNTLIRKRHAVVVVAQNIFAILFVGFQSTLALYDINNQIIQISFVLTIYPFIACYCLRTWLLFFSIKWNRYNSASQWQNRINETHTNWYIENKKTWGSSRWVWKWFVLLCTIAIIIALGLQLRFETRRVAIIVDALFSCIIVMGVMVLRYKTPKFYDFFRIRDELKKSTRIAVSGLMIVIVTLCIPVSEQPRKLHYSFHVIRPVIGALAVFASTMISTWWVITHSGIAKHDYVPPPVSTKRRVSSSYSDAARTAIRSVLSLSNSQDLIQPSNSLPTYNANNLMLKDVLAHKQGIDMFAQHLLKEFSIENLLCVCELTQFKEYFATHSTLSPRHIGIELADDIVRLNSNLSQAFGDDDDDDDDDAKDEIPNSPPQQIVKKSSSFIDMSNSSSHIRLPTSIPQSSVVWDAQLCIHSKTERLIEKYIKPGADLEVNISSRVRSPILILYSQLKRKKIEIDNSNSNSNSNSNRIIRYSIDHDHSTDNDCLETFDNTINELLNLMMDSWSRFKATHEFTLLKNYMLRYRPPAKLSTNPPSSAGGASPLPTVNEISQISLN